MSALPIDLAAFEAAPVAREPFPFAMVPHFVRSEAMAAINADYTLIQTRDKTYMCYRSRFIDELPDGKP